MDRKKAPHKLIVEDATNDDNSIVEMTAAKLDELKIFKGDTVLLKGKGSYNHQARNASKPSVLLWRQNKVILLKMARYV